MPRQSGRKKGSGTVELRMRINDLPIVREDLRYHLWFYDYDNLPQMDELVEDGIRDDVLEFEKLLQIMDTMEEFITLFKLKIKQPHLFERNQYMVEEVPLTHYRRTWLEQIFIGFTTILKDGAPRDFLPQRVQFGADVELMLDLMEHFFGSPGRSIEDIIYRGVSSVPKKRSPSRIHSFEPILEKKSRQWIDPEYSPRAESELSPLLTPQYKQNRFRFSTILRESLNREAHLDQVRVINANMRVRHEKACRYVASLFAAYKDLTFVAMDLCFDGMSSLSDRKDQLKEFKKRVRKQNDLLPPMVGHIGKWERTPIKGTYVRIICIFEKPEKHKIDLLPTVIGKYWVDDITHGGGRYHVAKLTSDWAILKGSTCTISASNIRTRKQFERRVILYLTHSQEFYRYKFNRNFDQQLKEYQRDLKAREKERQQVFEEGGGKKVRLKPKKSSGRYTALPVSKEPHDIFFRGEVVKPKSIVKKTASKQGQKVSVIEKGAALDKEKVGGVEVTTTVKNSSEMSAEASTEGATINPSIDGNHHPSLDTENAADLNEVGEVRVVAAGNEDSPELPDKTFAN